ncbi:MAG: hypothetical protein ACOX5G_04585 [Kiritimatiellia bacterium]
MNPGELELVRELARRYRDVAESERHVRMRRRFRDTNDLKVVRPPVHIEELPWHEIDSHEELACRCADERLRAMERHFRTALFREKHFRCDNYIEPVFPVGKAFSSTGCGFQLEEERLAVDPSNPIVSHHYHDILADERSLERYHDPVVTADPARDAAEAAFAEEVLDGILPVELRGYQTYHAPWDAISMLRGVEPILLDMVERPGYLHRIIGLFTRAAACEIEQKDALRLFDPRSPDIHCTPAAVTVPNPSPPGSYHPSDVWFRTMAQMFSAVSPDAHDEFDVQYSLPLARRFAFTYYGCCEPLHDRLHVIRKYPNLRKVGATPWADVERIAEALGPSCVLSRKPNPANVAATTDPGVVRAETEATVRACLEHGTPCDITLKDISTIGYRLENLEVWAQTVSDVLDRFYDKA